MYVYKAIYFSTEKSLWTREINFQIFIIFFIHTSYYTEFFPTGIFFNGAVKFKKFDWKIKTKI